jgi:hypothetical protein
MGRANSNIHQFTHYMTGKRENVAPHKEGVGQKSGPCTATFNDLLCFAPHKSKDLTLYSIFMLYFGSCCCFIGGGDQLILPTTPVSDVSESEMFLFQAVVIQMEHDT